MSDAAPSPGRPRYRTLPEKIGSVVLGFESIVVFLAGLSVFGLRALPEQVAPWWGVVAGAIVAVLMIVTSGLLRYRWAFAVGWALQAVTALGAVFVPAILVVTLVFGGMWAYATIGGARIERRVSAQRAAGAASD
ncbi:DUF4233 domain-containing protein [Microbacterium betulae]|uniref:DUF4233 domain-containing protein n=1 Tax=Microbacterium betulae TaxID=2981139 RepID=A0AA97FKQ9_9MICO|nr:DUF4233 domain-containing protein [Microbacterium sp. AB]WOF24588.1 DUF4233 domain-containing protein [Microbacterium sp. AB]